MGYEVHITRKENWLDDGGPEITLEDWLDYVASDDEMRSDGYAKAETPEGTLRIDDPGIAVWTAWSKHEVDGGMAWFMHFENRVSVKNPDKEMLKKMHRIASATGAIVQGDEGEAYDAEGGSNWQEQRGGDSEQTERRPWWRFWR